MQMIQPYMHATKNIDNVIWSLANDSTVIIQWFTDNFMKLNTDKCHFMVPGKSSNQDVTVNVGSSVIGNTDEEKLLGVTIDKKLTFEMHINKLCKKAGKKLFAFSRMSPYMNSNKLRIVMRAFVMSQFQYCQLAWMFHGRHLNNKINKIHEKDFKNSLQVTRIMFLVLTFY